MYSASAPPGPIRRGGSGNGNPPANVQMPPHGAPNPSLSDISHAKIPAPNTIVDMFDHMKAEYEVVIHQLNASKIAQLEMERKVQSQVVEMELIQQTLQMLEANHRRICQKHEEDAARLRRQVEASRSAPPDQLQTSNKRIRTQGGPGSSPAQSNGSLIPSQPASAVATGVLSVPPRCQRSSPSDGHPPTTSPPSRDDVIQGTTTHQTNDAVRGRAVPSLRSLPTKPGLAPLPSVKMSASNPKQGVTSAITIEKGSRGSQSHGSSSADVVAPAQRAVPKQHRGHRHGSAESSSSSSSTDSEPQAQAQAQAPVVSASASPATCSGAGISVKQHAPDSNPNVGSENSSEASATAKAPANSRTSRLNWRCVYPSKVGGAWVTQDSEPQERPAPGMHQSMHHDSAVCAIRLANDGALVATGSYKSAQVFNVETGERKFIVSSHLVGAIDTDETAKTSTAVTAPSESDDDSAYVRALCFSPDSTKLVAGMPRNTVRAWDIASNEEGSVMTGHEAPIYSLDCFDNIIVSGSGDRTIRLWDARSGQCKKVFGGNDSDGPTDGITSVALSPDSRLLAAGSLDKVVRVWDTETAQVVDRLDGHSDSVYSIAFSSDGKQLISGSFDRTVMLWDAGGQGRTTTRPRMVFQGHRDLVLSVAYTPDGRWFLSGSKDRSVVFWDPRSSRSVLTLTGHRNSVISVASSPASPYFATASGDGLGVVWKYRCESF